MQFRTLLILFSCCLFTLSNAQDDRYVSEVFDSIIVIDSIQYGTNVSVLTGEPLPQDLFFDVYMPAGDTLTDRPLALVVHTGTFLPPGVFATTGNRFDYASVQVATRLAKMGYTAISYDYRVGWNPIAVEDIVRRATILQAAYRSIQDTYSLLRFLSMLDQDAGDPYGVDMDRVAIFGIGTGGFVAMNMVALDDWRNEIFIDKFRNPVDGTPFIDTLLLGNIDNTTDGVINVSLHVDDRFQDDIHFAFGLDGALGDSTWIDADGEKIPMVLGGIVSHPTTPFGIDPNTMDVNCDLPVFTSGSGLFVVNVAGSACLTQKANELGYNDVLMDFVFEDPVSDQIRNYEFAQEHLWSIELPGQQAGAWEYWDSTFWKMVPSPLPDFESIHESSLATNPDMSLEKANNYIDTALAIFGPRACVTLGLGDCGGLKTGLDNLDEVEYSFNVAPNPTSGHFTITLAGDKPITRVLIFDMMGRVVKSHRSLNHFQYEVDLTDLAPGVYGIRAELGQNGFLTSKVMLQN